VKAVRMSMLMTSKALIMSRWGQGYRVCRVGRICGRQRYVIISETLGTTILSVKGKIFVCGRVRRCCGFPPATRTAVV
jgi:hypothetical protein